MDNCINSKFELQNLDKNIYKINLNLCIASK